MAWCPNCRRSFSSRRTLAKHKNLCDLERKEAAMKASIEAMEKRDIEVKNLCDEVLEWEVMRLQAENHRLTKLLDEAVKYLKQGKAQFAPNTTNSLVDTFIDRCEDLTEENR